MAWATRKIRGQESFLLRSNIVDLAITRQGGHLGPVTFFPGDSRPVCPYAIAPWAEEPVSSDTPAVIQSLRGDFFCSAFGANNLPYNGRQLPLHGESANGIWEGLSGDETPNGSWMRLGINLPLQGGRCEATTALIHGHSVVYQRHELSGLTGRLNPGHHATLGFSDTAGAARLSFSRTIYAGTYLESSGGDDPPGRPSLAPDSEICDLAAAPCIDGTLTDLTHYPARRGFEDIAILCADPTLEFAWSSATFPQEGFVWFALRVPQQLASTLLWFSNGGRSSAPWNSRHVNVLGVEDITSFFHTGLEASCSANSLVARGIPTCLEPDSEGRLTIAYIQGVARVPAGFDRVTTIRRNHEGTGVQLRAETGAVAQVACHLDFLRTFRLPQLRGI
jgi:hypothetical protein